MSVGCGGPARPASSTTSVPGGREFFGFRGPAAPNWIWGFPKIRGTLLGISIRRIVVILWRSILGFPYLGKLPFLPVPQNVPGVICPEHAGRSLSQWPLRFRMNLVT